jgi:CHAT domain-containing protein
MNFFRIVRDFLFIKWSIATSLVMVVGIHSASSKNDFVVLGDTVQAAQFVKNGLAFASARKYDSAKYYLKKAAVEYEEAEDWDQFFFTQHTIGYLLNTEYKYPETYHYMDSIEKNYVQKMNPQLNSYQRFYGVLAWSQFNLLNFDKALFYLGLCDTGAEQNPNVKPVEIMFSKYYQGVIYQRLGQYDKALELMLLVKSLGFENSDDSYQGQTYNNLGIIYRNLGEYNRTLEFYQKAIIFLKSRNREITLTPMYNNLAIVHYHLKDYNASLRELDHALEVLREYTNLYIPIESALIETKALVLIELGDFKQTKLILEKLLARESEKYGEIGAKSAFTLTRLGQLYAKLGDYARSNSYFDQSIAITQSAIGSKTDKLSEIFILKGQNYLLTKQYDSALNSAQLGIISVVEDFNDLDYQANPGPNAIILDKVELIESLYLKSKILLAIYHDTKSIEYLTAAISANQSAINLVDVVRKNMLYESSKLNLSNRAKSIYEQSIEMALLLEKVSNTTEIAHVFAAMENSKAYLLSESIQKAKALGYSNLPESTLAKEDSFRTKIKVLEARKANILIHSQDSLELAKLDMQLFSIKELFEEFSQEANAGSLIQWQEVLEIKDIQARLTTDELIIEYFAGENQLYAIALSKKKAKVYELGAYNERINSFVSLVRNIQQISTADYQSEAYEVYNVLLAPILADNKQAKSLVIIPDKQLGYIPFDALVTEMIDEPKYNNLPYLILKYVLLHHQTVNLYADRLFPQELTVKEFIGFAPDFNENEVLVASNNQLRNDLQPLPYAKKEVIAISQLLNGIEETGSRASENNLKAMAASFNILHLATHAIIDEENPLYSKLLFNLADSALDDDGELHSFEIYGMKLNASLVTLSACNTGTGKYLEGEGIFSLGRSFLLAGAKSVLTSLWEVSDLSTSQIMESFYANLKKGEATPIALRQAKLDYLNSADPLTANPHYWAAFVYIGQPQSVYQSSKLYYWLAGFGFLFLGIVIMIRKNRNLRST